MHPPWEAGSLLTIDAFADAMEITPKTLAYNAILDQTYVLVAPRSKHKWGMTSACPGLGYRRACEYAIFGSGGAA